ncbi:Septation initiation network scaffold protein cdc11 [Sphaceloma murrayae]|uniref:Septation initiation network scaffold protein cdc11 n=1 Tax=Sphaceloma murrayae TaxID=2082308 RepID=A0A2K1QLH2_9PEZI|nr:Septation initiation network scaffold protein cdc11 [Sphaceloma murrayae]
MKGAIAVALAALAATGAAAPTTAPSKYDTCYAEWLKCKQAPSANNAACSAQIASCLGYNPFTGASTPTSTLSSLSSYASSASSSAIPTGQGNATEAACLGAFYTCKGKPNANNAQCNSELSACLGYFPYDRPTTTSAPASTTTAPGNSTEKVCYDNFNACKAQPDANNALCASQISGCLGYNPFERPATSSSVPATTTAPGNSTEKACYDKFNVCKAQPNANNALCASQISGCLGYNPFERPSTTSSASVSATTTASGNSTEKACYDKFYSCKAQPSANNALCASQISGCLGYNPFERPSTTSSASISATTTASGNSTEKACYDKFNACKAQPSANNALCASQISGCLGYNPFERPTTTSAPVHQTTTTVVVSSFTTYCPEPTIVSYGTQTFTVTSATTLTITDCPCTITKPVPSTTAVPPPATTPSTTSMPSPPSPPVVHPPTYSNSTSPPVYPNTTTTIPAPPASETHPVLSSTTIPAPPASETHPVLSSTTVPAPPASETHPVLSSTTGAPPAETHPVSSPSSVAPPAPSTSAPPAPSTTAPTTTQPPATTPATSRQSATTASTNISTRPPQNNEGGNVVAHAGGVMAAVLGAVALMV